jgi:hypothetical protein
VSFVYVFLLLLNCLSHRLRAPLSPAFGSGNRNKVQDSILNKKLVFPKQFTAPLQHLLKGLLNRDPAKRYSFADVRKHAFFAGLDWNKLERKEIAPPFIPTVADPLDVSNFDERFTVEPVVDSPVFGPGDDGSTKDHPAFKTQKKVVPKAQQQQKQQPEPLAAAPPLALGSGATDAAPAAAARLKSVVFDPAVAEIEPEFVTGVGFQGDGAAAGAGVIFNNQLRGGALVCPAAEVRDCAPAPDAASPISPVPIDVPVAAPEAAPEASLADLVPVLAKAPSKADLAHYTCDNDDDRNMFKGFNFVGDSPYVSARSTPLAGPASLASLPSLGGLPALGTVSSLAAADLAAAPSGSSSGAGGYTPSSRSRVLGLAPPAIGAAPDSDDEDIVMPGQPAKDAASSPVPVPAAVVPVVALPPPEQLPAAASTPKEAPAAAPAAAPSPTVASPAPAPAPTPVPTPAAGEALPRKFSELHNQREGLWHHHHQHKFHHFDYRAAQQHEHDMGHGPDAPAVNRSSSAPAAASPTPAKPQPKPQPKPKAWGAKPAAPAPATPKAKLSASAQPFVFKGVFTPTPAPGPAQPQPHVPQPLHKAKSQPPHAKPAGRGTGLGLGVAPPKPGSWAALAANAGEASPGSPTSPLSPPGLGNAGSYRSSSRAQPPGER